MDPGHVRAIISLTRDPASIGPSETVLWIRKFAAKPVRCRFVATRCPTRAATRIGREMRVRHAAFPFRHGLTPIPMTNRSARHHRHRVSMRTPNRLALSGWGIRSIEAVSRIAFLRANGPGERGATMRSRPSKSSTVRKEHGFRMPLRISSAPSIWSETCVFPASHSALECASAEVSTS
jgi:hypothetical protein